MQSHRRLTGRCSSEPSSPLRMLLLPFGQAILKPLPHKHLDGRAPPISIPKRATASPDQARVVG
jgi:hypothetical protein